MFSAQDSSAPAGLDPLDLRVLTAFAERPEETLKALAQRIGAPASTVAYRLRLLREQGVITGLSVRFDMAALGRPVQAIIRVRLGHHSKEGVESLFAALQVTPGVRQVFHIAGADDFLVHVAVADSSALRDIVLEHITVHEAVRATETQLVFERREGRMFLPPAG